MSIVESKLVILQSVARGASAVVCNAQSEVDAFSGEGVHKMVDELESASDEFRDFVFSLDFVQATNVDLAKAYGLWSQYEGKLQALLLL